MLVKGNVSLSSRVISWIHALSPLWIGHPVSDVGDDWQTCSVFRHPTDFS
jgi:hypothetical protein